jgi:hypothetical protein
MTRFQIAMRTPRRGRSDDENARLQARIEDLELRVKLLEARVRLLSTAPIRPGAKERRAAHGRARPRCAGCMLELPPGKRGNACVWCGFRFDVVAG